MVEEENTQLKEEVERLSQLLLLINEKIQLEGDKMAAISYRQKEATEVYRIMLIFRGSKFS